MIFRDLKGIALARWLATRKIVLIISWVLGGSFLVFIIADWIFPFSTRVPYSTLVMDRDGEILHAFLSEDDKWRLYLEPVEITEDFKRAILFKEDQYFYYHPGVNPVSVVRALFQNATSGQRKSGASTITMQVARLLHPKPRTYGNKLIEMFNAMQLELHLGKDEILRLYLNLLPYGGNIEGVKSASNIYFGKAPELLSLSEIAGLVVIPNRPSSLAIDLYHVAINEAKNEWLDRFGDAGLFDDDRLDIARAEDLEPKRRPLRRDVPHLAIRLRKRHRDQHIIRTFINHEQQKRIEELTRAQVNRVRQMNIQNAVVLVVDNEHRQVTSYIGSADFNDSRDGGQVDGTQAVRSPGSTLKPYLYALLFDRGELTPRARLADVYTDFRGYRPVNYDNEIHGWVTAAEALQQSLNIPAVKLLNELGVETFIEALEEAKFQTIAATADNLGLSLALGGCGTTLEELVHLYSAFANAGHWGKLQYARADTTQTGTQSILSEAAAFILTDLLTEVVRPDLPDSWKDNPNRPQIAWKTGTSFGRRDAWSIGYNQDYTVGVWVGNFSGEGAPDLSGTEVAAPLLFNVFNMISSVSKDDWYQRPRSVALRSVCDASGMTPNTFCSNFVTDYAIRDVTTYQLCDHMQPVLIATDSSESYCQTCLKDQEEYVEAWYPNMPSEIVDYYRKEKIAYLEVPDHYRFCERVYPDQGLEIVSPTDKVHYYLDKQDAEPMLLKALAPSNSTKFYWYVNDVFFKAVGKDEQLYLNPPEGRVKISCSDDRGRNQDIVITVEKVGF